MHSQQLRALLAAQQTVIEQIALASSLKNCLKSICEYIESILPNTKVAILILNENQLILGAAPSLPDEYNNAIEGLVIGASAGSSGTAAYTGKQVIVSDVATDPLWLNFKEIALAHNLCACWSTPIFSSSKKVLGTCSIYYDHIAVPSEMQKEIIACFTHLAGLALEKEQARRREAGLLAKFELANAKLEAFVEVIPDLAIILNEDGVYVDVYGAKVGQFYQNEREFIGRNIRDILPYELANGACSVIKKTLSSGIVQTFEYELETPKGRRIFEGRVAPLLNFLPEQGNKFHVLWMARDITERKNAEMHIEKLAFYDLLTGLPNRRMLFDRLQTIIEKTKRTSDKAAVLYIDLNDFKRINDSLGHSEGDKLLVLVAERLAPVKRSTDTFARIGGDEFVLLLDSSSQPQENIVTDAVTVSQRLIKSLSKPFALENGSYKIGASIGISIIEGNSITANEILKRADTAMYAAKKMGGSNFSFYDPSIQDEIDRKLQIECEIIFATEQRQFCAYFQPQVDPEGNVIGAEALIRWLHPERGLIAPLHFISIAENSGLIFQLQNIVMEDCCQLLTELQKLKCVNEDFKVSVNISSNQFRTAKLDENLLRIIAGYNVSPNNFVLEITESLLLQNKDETVTQMNKLKQLGFRFSVDDFGTGYSSLAYLHALPLDELKIDKTFVDQIHLHERGTAIIDSIISLASHLKLHVIAEGVETDLQFECLAQRSIRGLQGYLFSKPLAMQDFIRWITNSSSSRKNKSIQNLQYHI